MTDVNNVEEDNLSDWERYFLDQNQLHLDDQLTEKQVAASQLLPAARNTLRISRSTGNLAGVDAPPYIKIGTMVRYTPRMCFGWTRGASEVKEGGHGGS